MKIVRPFSGLGSRATQLRMAGALTAVAIASVVYSQFNIDGYLTRDSTIYLYGGQRFTHGVPPYASIMDPKGPMSSILCGIGVAVARLVGRNDVLVVRAEFCALAILGVLGVYLLVLELWQSVVAALVAAAVFVSFSKFAHQALVGPDGHAPGTVFLIFAMWLTVRRNWYWAGFAASLAFLTWQPLLPYLVIATICAAVWSPGHRLRQAGWVLAGGATPLVVLMIYYAAEGYLGSLFEGLFVFPLTGVRRPSKSVGERLAFFFRNVADSYGASAILLWTGLVLLLAVAAWTVISARPDWRAACLTPVVLLIVVSFLAEVAYVLYDYIGWTHAFPLLPYAAVGYGAAAALVLDRLPRPRAHRVASAVLLTSVAALTVTCAVTYHEPTDALLLRRELAGVCAIKRSLVPGTPLWTLGDPRPLVLLHRPNPDNYPYLGSGEDVWKVEHTKGGLEGWTKQITASRASVLVFDTWVGPYRQPMRYWLRTHGYHRGYIGLFRVYVTDAARTQMAARSIALVHRMEDWPRSTTGKQIFASHCGTVAAG